MSASDGATIVVPIAGSSTPSRRELGVVERPEAGDRGDDRVDLRLVAVLDRCVAPSLDQRRRRRAERRSASARTSREDRTPTTTRGASITVPSASSTPRTWSPSHTMPVTRAPERSVPPAPMNAPRMLAGTAPLPPTGRPTLSGVLHRVGERAEAGVRGERRQPPHRGTGGHCGAHHDLAEKNERSTSAAVRRLQRSIVAAPRARRAARRLRTPPAVGGSHAISSTSSATGIAAAQ